MQHMKNIFLILIVTIFAMGSFSCKKKYRCTPNTKDTTGTAYWSPDFIDMKFTNAEDRAVYEKEEHMTCKPL
jgi:hypothetical protein